MRSLVLHFCGPHRDETWSPLYHRIDAAVQVARPESLPILIVGDAHHGEAVAHFAAYARERGIRAFSTFDPGARTLTDARAALRALRDTPELTAVERMLVVTDDWHVERCLHMLRGEYDKILANREIQFLDRSTPNGPRPPAWVLDGERRGIDDYLAARPYVPFGKPFGKPAHPVGVAHA